MKHFVLITAASALLAAFPVSAEVLADSSQQVIAKQGNAVVYAIDVDAHVAPMRAQDRAGFLDSPKRIEQMLGHMLIRRNLALEAKELKLDQDPIVQREIELAAEGILMRRRLDKFREDLVVPDMSMLVKERYLTDPTKFRTDDQAEVAHILLKPSAQRGDAEIQAQLKKWRAEILAGKAKIEDLAAQYSDEPAAKSSGGALKKSPLSRYVTEFSDAIRKLRNPGDVSMPVQTDFGWHLIQLKSFEPGRQLSFEDVRDDLLAVERQKYISAEQEKYVTRLKDLPIEASEASVTPLRERYGSLDYDAADQPKTESAEQEVPKQ